MEITEVGSGANKENEGASMRQKMLEISAAEKAQQPADEKKGDAAEGDEAKESKKEEEAQPQKKLAGYEFKVVPPQDPRVFPNFRKDEVGRKLFQW